MLFIIPAFSIAPVPVSSFGDVAEPIVPSLPFLLFLRCLLLVPPFVYFDCVYCAFLNFIDFSFVLCLLFRYRSCVFYSIFLFSIPYVVPWITAFCVVDSESCLMSRFLFAVALLLPVPSIAFCAPNDRLPPDSLFIPASVPSIVPSKLELPPSFICPMSPALSIP